MLLTQPLSGWNLWEEMRIWHLFCGVKQNDSRGKERARRWGCAYGVGGCQWEAEDHIWQEERGWSKDRLLALPRTMTRYCAERGRFYSWEMKLERSLDTNKMYYGIVGRGYHGNSFLYIENIQVCFPKVWQSWETSSQENIQWSPEVCVFKLINDGTKRWQMRSKTMKRIVVVSKYLFT